MFEQWPERRRRWFLITFCATAWALFCSSLASLGPHASYGGIGPDPLHIVELVGTVAVWTAAWSMFKLRMWHWLFAVIFGATLTTALIDFGLRDHAKAGLWYAECDRGSGDACHNLADYYASGRSPLHGWLDAGPIHQRACDLGGVEARNSCEIAGSAGFVGDATLPLGLRAFNETDPCDRHLTESCYRDGLRHEQAGNLLKAYDRYERACRMVDHSTPACLKLLDTGFHDLRIQACNQLETSCAISSTNQCRLALVRCHRVRSPFAGTGP